MSMSSTYKPSPLSFGSPRSSPFRRPESPASPTTTVRATTPTTSPIKAHTPVQSPLKLQNSSTPTTTASDEGTWTPRGLTPSVTHREPPASPTRGANNDRSTTTMGGGAFNNSKSNSNSGDALAKLHPAQVKEMREGFQILDRDSDGHVTRDDVVDMLTNLNQDPSTTPFFPPGTPQTLSLPTFLHTLSALLAPLSSSQELLNAFAAFDDDDSGQVDVAELMDALLHTSPEAGGRAMTEREVEAVVGGFRGRREFAKNTGMGMGKGKRGDVFRYREFVGAVTGGGTAPIGAEESDAA